MLKKTFGKRMASGIVTAAMAVSASVAVLPSMCFSASAAGEMLGMTDFNDGIGLPWHTCVTPPASLNFSISGGTYNIEIVNRGGEAVGGESRWDCQFRHRGLSFYSGNSYTVKAEVTIDHSGEIFTKIGDLSGQTDLWHNGYGASDSEFGASWNCMPVTANQKLTIDSTWTCNQDMEVAEWTWQFGGKGAHQPNDCFPNGTKLVFDNMSCYNNTDDRGVYIHKDPPPEYSVHGNQVGYYTNLSKKATFHSESQIKEGQTIYIIDAKSGKSVYEGKTTTSSKIDTDSGMYCGIFDFSDFTTAGTYYFSTDGKTQDSYEFTIGDKIYDGVVKDALNYFYQNRSGIAIDEKYITSTGANADKSALAHPAGHNPDTAYIQSEWIKAYKSDGSDVQKSSGELTATGGWYDAGDHGKYVVNGGISVWTLQNLYEWTLNDKNNSDAKKFGDSSSSIVVPEAGNGAPDLLDEARVELEWFFDMMVGSNYSMKYDPSKAGGADTGKYQNMVFHKMHDHKWTGLAVKAWDYDGSGWEGMIRIVKPPSTCATLNVAACAAQAARLWEDYDADFAATCLEKAKETYEAAKLNPELYAPLDEAIGGGAYGDNNAKDDFYWAACELYLTTGDAKYLTDLESYADAYKLVTSLDGGENSGSYTSFNWGNTAGLGTLSLFLNSDKISEKADDVAKSITATADSFVETEGAQGFGIPYQPTTFEDPVNLGPGVKVTGYEWGSNSMVVNNAIVMAYAYAATGDATYLNGVSEAMDYIFGRNAMDFSYVTGYGTYHCVNPHHRLWSHELDKEYPYAPAGVMSGGPNAGLQDPYVGGAGLTRGDNNPSQLCYVDSIEAWSVNEVTINWNSPFAWVMSFLEDEAGGEIGSVPEKTQWGNVDCSTESTPEEFVTIGDAVLLARLVAEDATVEVSVQGKLNADVKNDSALDAQDVNLILQYLAKLVPYSDLGQK